MTISDLIELLEYFESKNQEVNEKQEEKYDFILDEVRSFKYDLELIKEKLKIKNNLYWLYRLFSKVISEAMVCRLPIT